jgi:organic radical activating enzyme
MPNPNYFCTSPFIEVRINQDGSINFCHHAENKFIRPEENIQKMNIDDYFNNSVSVKERNILLSGGKLNRCEKCYAGEKIDYAHFRKRRNLQFGIFPGEDFQQSFNESDIQEYIQRKDLKPHFYHISLSNLCNLGCIMCDHKNSSVLAKDFKNIGIIPNDTPTLIDWTLDKKSWDSFLNHIKSNEKIICIHFMGGEPLYHKKFYEFINYCIDNNHYNFHLTFVTNGTIVPDEEFIEKLKKFKSIQVEVSIEAFDSSSDYVRFPSQWIKIKENLEKYISHTNENFSLCIRTVPQFFTLLNYDVLLQWCLDNNIVIDSNIMFYPVFFKPVYLPIEIKNTVIDKLKKFMLDDLHNVHSINIRDKSNVKKCVANNARMVLNQLSETVSDQETQIKKMINYLSKLDRVRNIDVRNYLPMFLNFLNNNGYEEIRYKD